MHSQPRYTRVKADAIWMIGVVVLHFAGAYVAGEMIPEEVVFLDWSLHSLWFACLAAIDLIAVILLLRIKRATVLIAVMYASTVWSTILALEAALRSDSLIQLDWYAQLILSIGILVALAWGVYECRDSRPQSSSLRW